MSRISNRGLHRPLLQPRPGRGCAGAYRALRVFDSITPVRTTSGGATETCSPEGDLAFLSPVILAESSSYRVPDPPGPQESEESSARRQRTRSQNADRFLFFFVFPGCL